MYLKSIKRLVTCIVILAFLQIDISFSQSSEPIDLTTRDACVSIARPFYGSAYNEFLRAYTEYKEPPRSLMGYYDMYLEDFPKEDYSSLFSDVLQELHVYAANALLHDTKYNGTGIQASRNNSFFPILEASYENRTFHPLYIPVRRRDILDDATNSHGQHGLNELCANTLQVKVKAYVIRDLNKVNNYEKAKNKFRFLSKHATHNPIDVSDHVKVFHNIKLDLNAQKQELQEHIGHIQTYTSYLDNNNIDLSDLIDFLQNRINSIDMAILKLTELGYSIY